MYPLALGDSHDDTDASLAFCTATHLAATQEKRKFVRRYVCRAWAATWCRMLRKNMFACVEDTSEGVRRPRISTGNPPAPASKSARRIAAAPTGPYPAPSRPRSDNVCPPRPAALDTINTPVVVAPTP